MSGNGFYESGINNPPLEHFKTFTFKPFYFMKLGAYLTKTEDCKTL